MAFKVQKNNPKNNSKFPGQNSKFAKNATRSYSIIIYKKLSKQLSKKLSTIKNYLEIQAAERQLLRQKNIYLEKKCHRLDFNLKFYWGTTITQHVGIARYVRKSRKKQVASQDSAPRLLYFECRFEWNKTTNRKRSAQPRGEVHGDRCLYTFPVAKQGQPLIQPWQAEEEPEDAKLPGVEEPIDAESKNRGMVEISGGQNCLSGQLGLPVHRLYVGARQKSMVSHQTRAADKRIVVTHTSGDSFKRYMVKGLLRILMRSQDWGEDAQKLYGQRWRDIAVEGG